jgi:protein TonB
MKSAAAEAAVTHWSRLLEDPPRRAWRHLPTLAGVLAAHLAAGWALMQVDAVRQTVAQAAPLMVDFITLAPPKPEAVPPPPPPPQRIVEKPRPTPLITAAPTRSPAPPPFVAEPAPPEPPPVVAVNTPPEPAPPTPPAPPPPPKTVAATAVQYLRPPAPVYPALSRRLGEAGRVVLRVLIDDKGLPRQIAVQQSSGYPRLDSAALDAMRDARFKPYTENGAALPVWAPAPIAFDLE